MAPLNPQVDMKSFDITNTETGEVNADHKNLLQENTSDLPVPLDLLCFICMKLVKDAVITPCCCDCFCHLCIYKALFQSDDFQCPSCDQLNVSPNDLIPTLLIRKRALEHKTKSSLTFSQSLPDSAVVVLEENNSLVSKDKIGKVVDADSEPDKSSVSCRLSSSGKKEIENNSKDVPFAGLVESSFQKVNHKPESLSKVENAEALPIRTIIYTGKYKKRMEPVRQSSLSFDVQNSREDNYFSEAYSGDFYSRNVYKDWSSVQYQSRSDEFSHFARKTSQRKSKSCAVRKPNSREQTPPMRRKSKSRDSLKPSLRHRANVRKEKKKTYSAHEVHFPTKAKEKKDDTYDLFSLENDFLDFEPDFEEVIKPKEKGHTKRKNTQALSRKPNSREQTPPMRRKSKSRFCLKPSLRQEANVKQEKKKTDSAHQEQFSTKAPEKRSNTYDFFNLENDILDFEPDFEEVIKPKEKGHPKRKHSQALSRKRIKLDKK